MERKMTLLTYVMVVSLLVLVASVPPRPSPSLLQLYGRYTRINLGRRQPWPPFAPMDWALARGE